MQRRLTFLFLAIATCLAACQTPTIPSNPAAEIAFEEKQIEERNANNVREFYDRWSAGKIDEALQLVATDCIDHLSADRSIQGVDSIAVFLRRYAAAFPDSRLAIEKIVADGDLVMVYGTWSGTHRGEFNGRQPTGKSFQYKDVDILRCNAEGKLAEHWAVQESCAWTGQVGWTTGGH